MRFKDFGIHRSHLQKVGKQEQNLKQKPDELEKLVEIAKDQSMGTSNVIEGILATNTCIKHPVAGKTTPKNCEKQEIVGYQDVLNIPHENFDTILATGNCTIQFCQFCKILYGHSSPFGRQMKNMQLCRIINPISLLV